MILIRNISVFADETISIATPPCTATIALRDIQQKRDYIVNTLKNRSAAQKLVYSILNAVSQLSENPYMGPLLSSKYDVDSDIRFLVVSKQMVFYRIVDRELVSVVRILDGRQDYIRNSILLNISGLG